MIELADGYQVVGSYQILISFASTVSKLGQNELDQIEFFIEQTGQEFKRTTYREPLQATDTKVVCNFQSVNSNWHKIGKRRFTFKMKFGNLLIARQRLRNT